MEGVDLLGDASRVRVPVMEEHRLPLASLSYVHPNARWVGGEGEWWG